MLLIGHYESISTKQLLYNRMINDYQYYFKNIPCYTQFTRGIWSVQKYCDFLLQTLCQMNQSDKNTLHIIDSTALPTNGYNKYEAPKWTGGEAKAGENIFGYFHGLKLHLIINRQLEVVSFKITPANIHDVKLLYTTSFVENINGVLVGDKGCVTSPATLKNLAEQGVQLIFKQRKNMDAHLNDFYTKYLKQRQVIEGVFSYLKNRLNLLQKFTRSIDSFLVHVKAALAAYMLRKLDQNFAM